jgi:hypothetical protein
MLDEITRDEIGPQLRTMQIIVVALCMGVIVFAVYLVLTGSADEQPELGILTFAAIGMAAVNAVISLIVPVFAISRQVRTIANGTWRPTNQQAVAPSTDIGKLLAVYQTALIIGSALLEGAAFFGLAAYMVERHVAGLVVAGICLALILSRFPTRGRLEPWVEDQLRRIKEQRQFTS